MDNGDFKKKFIVGKNGDEESVSEQGIDIPVHFKDHVINMNVYSSQPIHQVKDKWQSQRPYDNFQNYEIVLKFYDHRVETVKEHEEVDENTLIQVECILIAPAGFHHNVPVNPDIIKTQGITMKK